MKGGGRVRKAILKECLKKGLRRTGHEGNPGEDRAVKSRKLGWRDAIEMAVSL